jgi:uncharacterized NAD-dependent epimerase/dehydratase family protein
MDGNAIILTNGMLHTGAAKTAHGLIRGTDRYRILAVIDPQSAGRDAGEVVDGLPRGIPVYASFDDFFSRTNEPVHYALIGLASKGGELPEGLEETLKEVLAAGVSVVNGLHVSLSEMPALAKLAERQVAQIIDLCKPKPKDQLHFWTGKIAKVTCPRVAVLGTDRKLGKRTTTRFLTEAAVRAGLDARMIFTGQTGWMQGGKYGFVMEATSYGFVPGEIEHAIVSCFEEEDPDIMFIEGQSALRNPGGPGGPEFLLSGQIKYVVLQHAPDRVYYAGLEAQGFRLPPLREEIALLRMYGAKTLAVTLNTAGLNAEEAADFRNQYEQELGIPVLLPLEEGVDRIIPLVRELILPSY